MKEISESNYSERDFARGLLIIVESFFDQSFPKEFIKRFPQFNEKHHFSLFDGKLVPNYKKFAQKFEITFPMTKLPDLFENFSIPVNESIENDSGWIIEPFSEEISKIINFIPLDLKMSFIETTFGYFSSDNPTHLQTHDNALLMPLHTPMGSGLVCTHCLFFGPKIYIMGGIHPFISYDSTVDMLGLNEKISINNYIGFNPSHKLNYPKFVFDHLRPVNFIEWMINKEKINEGILNTSKFIINGIEIPYSELISNYVNTIENLQMRGRITKVLESAYQEFRKGEEWFWGEN